MCQGVVDVGDLEFSGIAAELVDHVFDHAWRRRAERRMSMKEG